MSRGFQGEFIYNLDTKGRLSIPVELRKVLADRYEEKVMLTRDPSEGYLVAYPLEEWQVLEEKLRALPQTKPAVKKYIRLVCSAAVECELDKQGRILIPPSLRDYAALAKEAVILGALTKIEIWDRDRYLQNSTMSQDELEELGI